MRSPTPSTSFLLSCLPALALVASGCSDDTTANDDGSSSETSDDGDGDGDPSGDGDGDPSGDGDGDPSGDGDGDPSGDGDGDPSGDGDGDPSGDGDGDGDGDPELTLTQLLPIGVYETGEFDSGAAEISAFDPASQRLFVVNGFDGVIDVLDLSDPTLPVLIDSVDLSDYGAAANSVAVYDGLVAAAIEADIPQDPGAVLLFDAADLSYVNHLVVGAMPDMVSFSPDGGKVVLACEGEPDTGYLDDPDGVVAIVDVSGDVAALTDADVKIAGFGQFTLGNLDPQVRIFGPGSSVAQDLEPEYVAISEDSTTAWVTLQENNALATRRPRDRHGHRHRRLRPRRPLAAGPRDRRERQGRRDRHRDLAGVRDVHARLDRALHDRRDELPADRQRGRLARLRRDRRGGSDQEPDPRSRGVPERSRAPAGRADRPAHRDHGRR